MDELKKSKLLDSFRSGLSIKQALLDSGVEEGEWVEECKSDVKFLDYCELLRSTPLMDSLKTIAKGVKESPELAMKYAERKLPDEFAPVTKARIEAKLEVDDKRVILD